MYEMWLSDITTTDYDEWDFGVRDLKAMMPWMFDDKMRSAFPAAVALAEEMIQWLNDNVPGHYFMVYHSHNPDLDNSTITIGMGNDNVFHKLRSYRLVVRIPDAVSSMQFRLMFGGGPALKTDD